MTVEVMPKPIAEDDGLDIHQITQEASKISVELSREGRARLKRLVASIKLMQRRLSLPMAVTDPYKAGKVIVASLKNAEGGAFSAAELAKQFQLSAAVLHRRRNEHRIIYWRDARHSFFYPRWQFNEAGALLPGIQKILQIFKSQDEWRIMRYFLGARKQLGGQRPLNLLRAGKHDVVVAHAKTHAEENTW
jgi:hypothetical protein